MSAFGNLSAGDDYHSRAFRLNVEKLMDVVTKTIGQVKPKSIALASVFYGKLKAHYYSLSDKDQYAAMLKQAEGEYDDFMKRAGIK